MFLCNVTCASKRFHKTFCGFLVSNFNLPFIQTKVFKFHSCPDNQFFGKILVQLDKFNKIKFVNKLET